MTRAFLLLSQLRLEDAFTANPVSPALLTAMGIWLVRPPRWTPRTRDIACGASLAAVLLGWALRCLPAGFGLPL